MENKFLLYLLYITFVELREHAYENNDKKVFWMCDLLHNVPLCLESEDGIKKAYLELNESVTHLGMEKWLENRMKEFYSQNPIYRDSDKGES